MTDTGVGDVWQPEEVFNVVLLAQFIGAVCWDVTSYCRYQVLPGSVNTQLVRASCTSYPVPGYVRWYVACEDRGVRSRLATSCVKRRFWCVPTVMVCCNDLAVAMTRTVEL